MMNTSLNATTMNPEEECGNTVLSGVLDVRYVKRSISESGCTVDRFLATFNQLAEHNQIADAAEACPTKCIVKL